MRVRALGGQGCVILIRGFQLKTEASIFLPFQRRQSSSPVQSCNLISRNIDVKM